ncbi:MAG: hypothetical protein R8K54_05840 [Mariprofundaceae bacterium]
MQEKELIDWLIEHAPLIPMCEAGGWPDLEHMNIETCRQSSGEWVIIVDFNEQLREISVCEPVTYNRCAKFSISLDENGEPVEVRLITRM